MRFQGVFDPVVATMDSFLADQGHGKAYRHFEDVVDDCDLIILASPQQYHAPQAAMALRAGRHVLSEVPAAVSMEQVQMLLGAARESDALYMIAENYCYFRENLIVAALARSGALGKLYFGEAEYLHEMKSWHRPGGGDPSWRYFWQVGKNAITYPTHSLGPLLQWMDDRIVALSCIGTGRWTSPENEMEDTVTLSARTRKGGLIRMRLDLLSNRPEVYNYYSLQGTGGAYESGRGFDDKPRLYLEGVNTHNQWKTLEEAAGDLLPARYATPPAGTGHWGSDAWPLLDMLDAIENGVKPPLDIYAALNMTLPGIVSEQSISAGGGWMAVPDPLTMTAGIGVNPGRDMPLF
jgi:predicted dehydrogenase